jgi:DNA-binding transcriptional regulator GbsR (MarR family)
VKGKHNGSTAEAPTLSRVKLEMIDACGRASQILGLPRSTGQIYGLLYVSVEPLCLDDIAELLAISKGSASLGTRQLEGWRAIRQVWVQGDRKDHFAVEPDLGILLRALYRDLVKPRVGSSKGRLDRLSVALKEDLDEGTITSEEFKVLTARLKGFHQLQGRMQTLIQMGEKIL